MRIRWRDFELPSRVSADPESASDTYAKFVVEPFERGFGNTIGNGIRRALLSSIEGFAITEMKIDNVLHEFSMIEGVLEDSVEIILNVKGILVRLNTAGPVQLRIDVKKEGPVTAGDIICPADAEILNPDHVICHLTAEREFRMEMRAQKGRGYLTAEENEREDREVGVLAIDSNFSPVVRVRSKVEDTRVGKITNYDRLVLEIWTDGTVSPESVLVEASKIYRKHLNPFIHYLQPSGSVLAVEDYDPISLQGQQIEDDPQAEIREQPISILELSVRARNCLDAENIRTIGQLIEMTEPDLLELRNFGQTSLREVKRKLAEHGLAPKGSVVETVPGAVSDAGASTIPPVVEVGSGDNGGAPAPSEDILSEPPEQP